MDIYIRTTYIHKSTISYKCATAGARPGIQLLGVLKGVLILQMKFAMVGRTGLTHLARALSIIDAGVFPLPALS
jgi:hypothetical protein